MPTSSLAQLYAEAARLARQLVLTSQLLDSRSPAQVPLYAQSSDHISAWFALLEPFALHLNRFFDRAVTVAPRGAREGLRGRAFPGVPPCRRSGSHRSGADHVLRGPLRAR